MTSSPNDEQDLKLVNFLRQHHPEVPVASPDLERRILQDIETLRTTSIPIQRRRSPVWLVPSVIAAGMVAAIVGYHSLVPPSPTPAELAKLERFMENNWQGTVGDPPEADVFSMTDSITDPMMN